MNERGANDPRNLIPFILPAVVRDGTRMGRGVIRIVPVANTDTDVAIAHSLARIPAFVIPLDNGTTYVPRVRRGAAAWTAGTVSVAFDTACPAPGVTLWIV